LDTRKALSPGCSEEFESLHEAHSDSKANAARPVRLLVLVLLWEDQGTTDEDEDEANPQINVPRAKCLLFFFSCTTV